MGDKNPWLKSLVGAIALAIDAGAVIMIAAFGELLGERSGIFNMGLEGTMAMGAVAAFITVTHRPQSICWSLRSYPGRDNFWLDHGIFRGYLKSQPGHFRSRAWVLLALVLASILVHHTQACC